MKTTTTNIMKLCCASCNQCTGNVCNKLGRRIEPDYNKCTSHQDYRVSNPIKQITIYEG